MPTFDTNLHWGPIHANSNVICVIDIRVGGKEPTESDLLEICVLPLNHSYKPHPTFPVFNMKMRPSYPVDLKEASIGNRQLLEQYEACLDSVEVAGLFDTWTEKLQLKVRKKILPMAFNWVDKKKWVEHWLGPLTFEHYFAESYRDALPVMNFVNDQIDYHGGKILFTEPTLGKLASNLELHKFDRNSLTANCLLISEAYRKLLHRK